MTLSELFRLLYGSNIQRIETGAFKNLPNLDYIDLHYNNIGALSADTFVELGSLNTIRLYQSQVQRIESGAFKDLPNLYYLDLGLNGITDIGGNAFKNLSSLRTLDLNRNSISVIENTTFAGLPNLSILDLDYNNIAVIQPNAFSHLTNLVILKLSSNRMNDVKRNYFNGLDKIQEILMPGNKLTFVDEEAFQDMTNLTILNLDVYCDCNIKSFLNWLNVVEKYESTIACVDHNDALLTSLPSCFFDKCNGPQCSTIVCNQNDCYYNYTGEVICRNEQDIKCNEKDSTLDWTSTDKSDHLLTPEAELIPEGRAQGSRLPTSVQHDFKAYGNCYAYALKTQPSSHSQRVY
ncbi:unnamed protein product [Mytilus edulis]|uniref:Uncharacterized protein n=1 Tax=Mytilus edulis TaxID=6550 RepID=A0A8S3UWI8_MYTED|nr:unnamed protein product [Mytilus edulis]